MTNRPSSVNRKPPSLDFFFSRFEDELSRSADGADMTTLLRTDFLSNRSTTSSSSPSSPPPSLIHTEERRSKRDSASASVSPSESSSMLKMESAPIVLDCETIEVASQPPSAMSDSVTSFDVDAAPSFRRLIFCWFFKNFNQPCCFDANLQTTSYP